MTPAEDSGSNPESATPPARSGERRPPDITFDDDDKIIDTSDPHQLEKAQKEIDAARNLIIEAGGFTPKIVDGLAKLHVLYPQHEPTTELYARALEQTQRWSELSDLMLERPIELRSNNESLKLAEALMQVNRFAEAADAMEPVLASATVKLNAIRLAGTANVMAGRMARGAEILDAHWDDLVAARRYEILYLRGVAHLDAGETDKGLEYLQEMIRLVPEHSLAHEALGRAYLAQEENDLGEQHLEQAQSIRATFKQPELIEMRVAVTARAATAAARQQQYDQCMDLTAELLPYAQGRNLALVYQLRANVLKAQGQTDLATQAAARAASILRDIEAEEAADSDSGDAMPGNASSP